MATTARSARPDGTGGVTTSRRTRPLSRDYGGDPRAAELADSIGRHQRAISEHEGAMLLDIAEFDHAEAWRGDGALSMRDWLTARCHVSRARARTLVESAAKAKDLPALAGALSAGRLTLDVFAPLASVATPETDADLARHPSTGHRSRPASWSPRSKGPPTPMRRPSSSAVSFASTTSAASCGPSSRGIRTPWSSPPFWEGPVATTIRAPTTPDYVRFESRCADALLQICIEQGRKKPSPRAAAEAEPVHGGARTTMIVHTDLDRLLYGDGYGHASIEGVGPVSAEVARRLACTAHITLSFDAPEGTSLDQKQLERDPTQAQRIEIRRRDKGCRFPGCGCRNVTDVHHIVWASRQGPTKMSNLLTLCVGHHSRVHELGWKLDGDANGEVRFISPQGRTFVSSPTPTWRRPRK